jgi:hypothetical protein
MKISETTRAGQVWRSRKYKIEHILVERAVSKRPGWNTIDNNSGEEYKEIGIADDELDADHFELIKDVPKITHYLKHEAALYCGTDLLKCESITEIFSKATCPTCMFEVGKYHGQLLQSGAITPEQLEKKLKPNFNRLNFINHD